MVRIEAITEPITIKIDRSPKAHEQADAIENAWQGLCAQNPRYFNGSMLAFDSYDPATGVIRASVEEYKFHAVRDTVDAGISLLAVTAIITSPNEQGVGQYLLGKRSPKTHRYGNLWELGPSGGVDVPANQIGTLDFDAIVAELKREIAEEVGLMIDHCACSPVVLVHDDAVGSVDIAIQIELEQMPDLSRSWEYVDTRWVSRSQLIEWAKKHPEDLIPTTVALALR
ncbi:hypothetical protein COB72_08930 [bacterium]|nr:MAG: hypothetical protein COB72_08930 [bacterium]